MDEGEDVMKRFGIAFFLGLFLCWAASSYAQDGAQQPDSNKQQERQRPPEAPPAARAPEATRPSEGQQEEKPQKPEKQEAPKPEKQENTKQSKEQPKPGQPEPGQQEHGRVQQGKASPHGKSAHIPDPQFKANFGRQHAFPVNRVVTQTTIVPDQTQFVYAGYTFVFLDPWPSDWLLTDDCYIDYVDDQYFLLDVFHPGVRVALFVVG